MCKYSFFISDYQVGEFRLISSTNEKKSSLERKVIVGHQVMWVRIDQLSGPSSSLLCWCVLCEWKTGASALPADSDVLCVCMCVCVCFWRNGGWKGEGGGFEFNRTPIAWCLSRVLAFYLLSVLFCALPLHPPLPLLLPSPSSVCLLADEFVSLSGFSQTLRHLLPTDTQTQR